MNTLDPANAGDSFSEPLAPLPAASGPVADELPARPVETLLPDDGPGEDVAVARPQPVRSRWKFWRRRSARDEQLAILREGCVEMVGLMRSIRDHLQEERMDRSDLKRSMAPLPLAMESMQRMRENQEQTGMMLGELTSHVARSADTEKLLVGSFDRFADTMVNTNETLGQMSRSLDSSGQASRQSLLALQALGQRLGESDRFVGETVARLSDAEHQFAGLVDTVSRRSAAVTVMLCGLLGISLGALAYSFTEGPRVLVESASLPGEPALAAPRATAAVPGDSEDAPRELRSVQGPDDRGPGALEGFLSAAGPFEE